MVRYILKRIAQFVPVFFGVTLLVFVLTRIAPGDAARFYLAERGIDYSPSAIEAARHELWLDKTISVQYINWLCGVLRGNLGVSHLSGEPVVHELYSRFCVTLLLTMLVFPAILLIAFPLGILCTVKQNSATDSILRCLNVLALSLPPFCLALLLILIFSVRLHLLPPFGFSQPLHYIMPCFTLVTAAAAYYTRLIRGCLLEEFSRDYILAARARGLPLANVVCGALRNAIFPVLTSLGMTLAHLLGGQVIIEKIFGIPGMGSYLIDGIMRRDYAVVQGCALLYTTLFSALNLTTDVVCAALDPGRRL